MIGGLNGLKGLAPKKRKGGPEGKVPEFVSATSINASSGALNLAKPTGAQDGDILVLCVKHAIGGLFFAPAAGWRHFGFGGSGSYCGEALAKVAAGEGSTLTIPNIGSVGSSNAILACFRGRTDFGDLLELPEVVYFTIDTFVTNPRIASRDGLFVLFASATDTHPSYVPTTPPAGMTQRHTHYGSGNSFLYTQAVKKGDDLSRAMVWGVGSNPVTIAMLL